MKRGLRQTQGISPPVLGQLRLEHDPIGMATPDAHDSRLQQGKTMAMTEPCSSSHYNNIMEFSTN